MPNIYLNYNDIADTYKSNQLDIKVNQCQFKKSNLFVFCKHTTKGHFISEPILAYTVGGLNPGSITIKVDDPYKNIPLSYAEVYFNKYDDKHQYPLVLLLHFTDKAKAPSRYYKMSKFDKDKQLEVKISGLNKYVDENDLLKHLIDENEKLENFLTYDIGLVKKVNNNKYNHDKISISNKLAAFGKNISNSHGFYKYTHTPCNTTKASQYKSVITFSGNLLKLKNSKDAVVNLGEIELQNYKTVNVYFGSKAKIKGANGIADDNAPLLVELIKLDQPNQHEYYCHHQNSKDQYWEKLDPSNYEKYTGNKPKKFMVTTILTSNSQMFLKLLKRLESYFLKTLVIMINKQNPYNDLNVIESYIDYDKSTIINERSNLPVRDITDEKPFLENNGFKVFEHDLTNVETIYDDYQIKFIIPTINTIGKYNEITLYSSKNFKSEHIESLSFIQDGYGETKVQVYFYDNDPRPLLLSFGEKVYKPRSKDKYSTEWVAIEDLDDDSEDNGSSLLKLLFEVIGFLNEVNISQYSDNYYYGRDYDIHIYDNKRIQLKVSSYYFDCYMKYEHKHTNSQGYRLGNIVYKRENKVKGTVPYDCTSPLIQVNVYYYNKDANHKYPLLVELEFKNNSGSSVTTTKEHYRLLKGDFNMTWIIDYEATPIANEHQKFREHLDIVKSNFNHVPELQGFSSDCGHNHLQDPTSLIRSYITTSQGTDYSGRVSTTSHGTDYSARASSPSHTHQTQSLATHGRSPGRVEQRTANHQVRMLSPQQAHIQQPPPETGVEKATRIASTVGTFAIAGTGTGVAIYKYSHWIINFFKRFF